MLNMKDTRTGLFERLNLFLDKFVLPYPVKFLTNRITIVATLCLLLPLLIYAENARFVWAVNSYLNVMSVVVSSTVLLFSTVSDVRQRAAAQRREEIARTHQEAVERRAQADHELIEKLQEYVDEIRLELIRNVNDSLFNIEEILVQRLEKIQAEDHRHVEEMHKAVLASTEAHHKELADLTELVQALHSGDLGKPIKPTQ
jgi:hypothetical protein